MSENRDSKINGPMFSVVIATYNQEGLIGRTVESVLNQSYSDYEVIVVDDGSTDGTLRALDEYRDRVQVITKENGGDMSARYAGAAVAKGTYIALVDGDDLWFPYTLQCYVDAIEEHGYPAIVMGRPHGFRNESELRDIVRTPTHSKRHKNFYQAIQRDRHWCGAGAMAVRKDAWEKYRGAEPWRVHAAGDTDFLFRAGTELSPYVLILGPDTYGYRLHDSQITASPQKTIQGLRALAQAERTGRYPNGQEDRQGRTEILALGFRVESMRSLMRRRFVDACRWYLRGLTYQMRCARFRYTVVFPALVLATMVGYKSQAFQWYG